MNCSNLRVFLSSILLAALLSGTTLRSPISAEHPGITHTLLFKGQVSGTDEQVIVWDTQYAPGAVNPRHLHPAAVTFRVISGTGIWQEETKSPVTLHAGEIAYSGRSRPPISGMKSATDSDLISAIPI